MKCLIFVCACVVSLVVCSACFASEQYTPRPFTDSETRMVPVVLNDAKMPWRKGVEEEGKKIEKSESESAAVEREILEELRAIRAGQSQRQESPVVVPAPVKEEKPSIREEVKAKVEDAKDAVLESPFLRHAAVLAALVAACMLAHAVYAKCHADKAKIQADLAALPVGGAALSAAFGKVDDVNTAIDAKVQSVKDSVESKLQSIQGQVTQVALATPAPAAAAPAATVASPAAAAK